MFESERVTLPLTWRPSCFVSKIKDGRNLVENTLLLQQQLRTGTQDINKLIFSPSLSFCLSKQKKKKHIQIINKMCLWCCVSISFWSLVNSFGACGGKK